MRRLSVRPGLGWSVCTDRRARDPPIGDASALDGRAHQEWARALIDQQPRSGDRTIGGALGRVCAATTEGLRVRGSAVSLMSHGGHEAVAAASSAWVRAVAALEFDLGEGPNMEAFTRGRPVLASTLDDGVAAAWPGFAAVVRERGVRAAFAFPVQVGATRLGVLSMYHDRPRVLDRDERRRGAVFAEIATELLLENADLGSDGDVSSELANLLDVRTEVFQAQGMVMVALGIGLADSLARMRAYAFSRGRDLDSVALDIVERRLDPTTELA